jgi:hypothetical protein
MPLYTFIVVHFIVSAVLDDAFGYVFFGMVQPEPQAQLPCRIQRVEQSSLAATFAEIGPKMGILHLLACLDARHLKLLVGFSSVIGTSGMAGNCW